MPLSKKAKRKYVVEKRSHDDTPFIIPNIYNDKNKEESPLNIVTSPHHGYEDEDFTVGVRMTKEDIRKYDDFRETPIDQEQKNEYSEFWTVKSKTPKVQKEEKVVVEETLKEEEETIIPEEPKVVVEEPKEEPIIFRYQNEDDEERNADRSLMSDLFGATTKEEEKPQIIESKPERKEVHIEQHKEQKVVEETIEDDEEDLKPDDYSIQEYAIMTSIHKSPGYKNYVCPPLSLLSDPIKKEDFDKSWDDENIQKINSNLHAFKIDGQVVESNSGPTFTRYAIMLGPGVSGSKIESISSDLQRALEATSIRIENPIPGKPYVGIEVPNKIRSSVYLKELLDREEFLNSSDPTLIPVGLDVEGNCKYISISSLPHGLVAGSSGSGKSVFLNTLISSLIFRCTPDDVRFFFIDPKQVDLQAYAKIPHLLSPIVDDVKGGLASIKWLLEEMERRFALFRILKVSNLKGYREAIKDKKEFRQVPYIICIIDEAGDFMMNGGNEAMDSVTKLIQKCRAAGIHLFISMQKPVAKVLSTTIKSNASGRFALRVPSGMDSMVILDSYGAEKLLGNGDMIFSTNGISGRFQSAFVSDSEIAAITSFVEKEAPQDFFFDPTDLNKSGKDAPGTVNDSLFPDVARYVVIKNKCSINQITQEFEIGYNRAAEIVKLLEYYNIVEESKGTKAREILVDEYELEEILRRIGI